MDNSWHGNGSPNRRPFFHAIIQVSPHLSAQTVHHFFKSFLLTNFTFLNMKDPTNLETSYATFSTPAMLPVLSNLPMKWLSLTRFA
jgi:hypothetical protein